MLGLGFGKIAVPVRGKKDYDVILSRTTRPPPSPSQASGTRIPDESNRTLTTASLLSTSPSN
ncbi:hypothetical protein PGT21_025194 [Puccinia graminis f. sp. tritici]|uniref:Uncharacterized protein n=1 Tax=Puccinia graminis f. sp. tritici TaxID=56615 RepID=A0A5B0MC26_PUCGR|nr:hypothetical protein PGT21_025194 [Puccinia graminis f. sp. tritici]